MRYVAGRTLVSETNHNLQELHKLCRESKYTINTKAILAKDTKTFVEFLKEKYGFQELELKQFAIEEWNNEIKQINQY